MKINKKFIIIALMSFIFALFSGGNLPYSIFYSFLIIILLGIIYILIIKRNIFIKIENNNEIYITGETECLNLIVRNYSILPTNNICIYNNELKKINNEITKYCTFLPSNASESIKISLNFKKRGIYDIGIFNIEIKDFFNIFTIKKEINIKNKVKVYPRIFCINEDYISGLGKNGVRSTNFTNDISSIKDIRKYRYGDNLKKIHWKLSAKHEDLYVKNYENIQGKECIIFLDMCEQNYMINNKDIIEELNISFTVSIINYMIQNNIKTKIYINDKKNIEETLKNNNDFMKFMEKSIFIKSDGDIKFNDYIYSKIKELKKDSFINLVIRNINENLVKSIINLKDAGYLINIFYIKDVLEDENIKKLKEKGIKCYVLRGVK